MPFESPAGDRESKDQAPSPEEREREARYREIMEQLYEHAKETLLAVVGSLGNANRGNAAHLTEEEKRAFMANTRGKDDFDTWKDQLMIWDHLDALLERLAVRYGIPETVYRRYLHPRD